MFSTIKNYILLFLSGVIGVLTILLKVKSYKISSQKQEIENKEVELEIKEEFAKIHENEAVANEVFKNVTKAEQATEQARKERDEDKSNDNSWIDITV